MSHGETETKCLGPGELASGPCHKRLRATAEPFVFPHHGSTDFHRIREKTGNDWVPLTVDGGRHSYPQVDKTKTTDLPKPLHNEMPGNKSDAVKSTNSQVLQDLSPPLISRDDGIYSTSKAFIGPIYKPPEIRKCNGKSDTLSGINGKRRREEKQKFNSKKLEIDSELSQFYKEIEELENEKDDSESSCKEPEPSQEQLTPYYQDHNKDFLKSDEEKKDFSSALQSHCDYQQCLGNEPGNYFSNGQEIATFCDTSFTSFRPEWQSVHPFVVPHGPPLPNFDYHLNIQQFSAPPNPPPYIFHAQDESQTQNGYYDNSCHVKWNSLTFDENSDSGYGENISVHPSRNVCSIQDGYVNGFCEIRDGCWKDPSVDKHNGIDRFVNQQFQEEKLNKLQKLLILLRGLPGSGKTTLSRILLGQSRDGIVFSTDDYFHHQDGYRYNVNQLGDAHDWNQSRAKQAIDQGRSPVIIDNTNTQAWEMKPYVEMAIGKGYRVEFHEPETWWKFDPEELEKRNKHGVSRKKIAQMLDRYEYEMSISIVMNSVEPTQKSTQRPPPPQGRQRERVMRKTGYTFCKTKQKRSRKRKKKQNNHSKIVEENSIETLNYVTPGDQDPSQSEEEDLGESGYPLTGDLGNELQDSVSGYKEKSWKYTDPEDSFPNITSVIELDNTPENHLPKEGDDLFPTFLSMPNQSSATCPIGTQNLSCVTRDDCSDMKVEEPIENRHTLASKIQDLFAETPSSFMQKREMIDKSLPNEPILCHQHGSRALDEASIKEQRVHATQNNYWAFFTTNLSDEDLQQGSDRQSNFGSWPEGPHKFVCEQRAKKQRSRKQACPDSREQLIKLISTSEGASETLTGDNLPIGNEDLPPPTETVDSFIETETNVFISCSPHLDIARSALESTKNKKERQKRIFSLAPNFYLLEQCHIDEKQREECDLFTRNHGLKIILGGEKDRISEMNNKEEDKQKNITFDHQPSCFHLDVIKDSPINIGGQFYSHCLSFSRLRDSVYFYKNPVPSLVLHYIVSSWKAPFTNKRPFLTFKSQTRVGNKLKDVGFIPSEMLSNQPESLHSLWVTSDLYFLNERFGEKLKIWEESKPLRCLPTEEIQDVANPGFHSLGLPLSQGFAFQLVKLFGSPGVPMESLLPDDYVIPLDWKTLKMIYLQWKASIEKRQKKID